MAKEVFRLDEDLAKIELLNLDTMIKIYHQLSENNKDDENARNMKATLEIAKECVIRCANTDKRRSKKNG